MEEKTLWGRPRRVRRKSRIYLVGKNVTRNLGIFLG